MRMQLEPLDNFEQDIPRNTRLYCTNCKQGEMIPAIEEGEPDYTDKYLCRACGHHATIPTIGNISGQIITGVMGFVLCLYLLASKFSSIIESFEADRAVDRLQSAGAIVAASVFLIGFMYVIYQAYAGMLIRRKYSRKPKSME